MSAGLLLVRVDFTAAAQSQTSWREWSAAQWMETALDFFAKAHWLAEGCACAWFVVLDEPFYRQRVLALQGFHDVKGVTVTPLTEPG